MQMKAEAVAAHGSSKVHALASTSTFLFSGGADKVCAHQLNFHLQRLMSCAWMLIFVGNLVLNAW
jgi:hypothetical protein